MVGEGKEEKLEPNVRHIAVLIWRISLIYLGVGTVVLGLIAMANGIKPYLVLSRRVHFYVRLEHGRVRPLQPEHAVLSQQYDGDRQHGFFHLGFIQLRPALRCLERKPQGDPSQCRDCLVYYHCVDDFFSRVSGTYAARRLSKCRGR